METEASRKRPDYFIGFEKLINHIIFDNARTPKTDGDGNSRLGKNFGNYAPLGATAKEMNHNYKRYHETFERLIDEFLIDCVGEDDDLIRSYNDHPLKVHFDGLTNDTLYHSDLIRYKKERQGESIRIYYIDTKQNQVEMVSFHIIHFLDLFTFIPPGTESLGTGDYESILSYYYEKLRPQQIVITS